MPHPRISLTVRVLTAVSKSPTPLKPHQVARMLNCPCNCVRVLLGRLVDRGDLIATPIPGGSLYSLPQTAELHVWDIFGVR